MSTQRDFVLARIAVARSLFTSALEALDACTAAFLFPEEDRKGAERKETLDLALDLSGDASRTIESAQGTMSRFMKGDFEEGEEDIDEETDSGGEGPSESHEEEEDEEDED